MYAIKCRETLHVWTMTNEGDRLNAKHLRAGHKCLCGALVIYTRHCRCGGRHKRVGTLADAAKHAKNAG